MKAIERLKREIAIYQLVMRDSRTPRLSKWLLGLAIGYLLSPIDIIPDFIPVFGHLDDVIIVPALIVVALKIVPKDVIAEHRKKLGIHPS